MKRQFKKKKPRFKLMPKAKKTLKKVKKFSRGYTRGVNAYLREDREQALKMKPNVKKIRF